jgi:hypothetical protein
MITSKHRNTMYLIGVFYFQNIVRFHGTLIGVISLASVRKVRPSQSRFSRHSQVLNSIFGRTCIVHFTEIGHNMWKLRTEINLRLHVKCDFYYADFHNIRNFLVASRGDPVPNLYKSDENIAN